MILGTIMTIRGQVVVWQFGGKPENLRTRTVALRLMTTGLIFLFIATGCGAEGYGAKPVCSEIAFVSNQDGNFEIYVMNANCNNTRLTNNPGIDDYPAWSPDGTRIAFVSDRDGHSEVYVMNADGSNQTRLTNNPAGNFDPAWSPDGTKIAFDSKRDGNLEIYVMNADGSNQTRLTNNPKYDSEPAWSPDGTKIAFVASRTVTQINVMDADGTNEIILSAGNDYSPKWSPDGTKIAFESLRDTKLTCCETEIFVMNANGSNPIRLTNDPAKENVKPPKNIGDPDWSPDGSQLIFISYREAIVASPGIAGCSNPCNSEIFIMTADVPGDGYKPGFAKPYSNERNPVWRPQ